MPYAPQHDWDLYEAATRPHDSMRLRGMSLEQRFLLYIDLHRFICRPQAVSDETVSDQKGRLEEHRWNEKLVLRKRMLKAFGAFR